MIKRILTITLFLYGVALQAQNTISPYSFFGVGEIQNKGFGATQNLGGAGIAYQSGNKLNSLNPASYTGIDSLRIIFEFGIEGKNYQLESDDMLQSGNTGNIKYVALGFRYNSWMAGSFGMLPFSSVGYSISTQNYVEGVNSKYTSVYTGSGGVSQFYYSHAIKLFKNFSVGVNASYMFGSLVQEETIIEESYVPPIIINRQDFLKSMYFDYGMRYSFAVGKTNFSAGITYSNKQNLKSSHILAVYDEDYSTIRGEEYNTDYLTVPAMFGAGIGIGKKGRYEILADYNFQEWAGVVYPNQSEDFVNSHSISMGTAFRPWEQRVANSFYKNWEYRLGVNYNTSYLKLGSEIVSGGSVSFGAAIPLPGKISEINLGFELGTNGTKSNNLIREKYVLFQLGFNLNEIAFLKRQIY
jgi:hypothetical protein